MASTRASIVDFYLRKALTQGTVMGTQKTAIEKLSEDQAAAFQLGIELFMKEAGFPEEACEPFLALCAEKAGAEKTGSPTLDSLTPTLIGTLIGARRPKEASPAATPPEESKTASQSEAAAFQLGLDLFMKKAGITTQEDRECFVECCARALEEGA